MGLNVKFRGYIQSMDKEQSSAQASRVYVGSGEGPHPKG